MDDDVIRPSWQDVHDMTMKIATDVLSIALGPDYKQDITRMIHHVVGVTRGGLIPAVILSHEFGLPLTCVDYSANEGAGDDKRVNSILPDLPYGSPILIIDDISDTGLTLAELWNEYTLRGHVVYTAVLYHKNVGAGIPDFLAKQIPEDAPWVVFPWE